MASGFRQLRKRRKLIIVWSLLGLLAVAHRTSRYCADKDSFVCSLTAEDFGAGAVLFGLLLVIIGISVTIRRVLRTRRNRREGGFKNEPWKFDNLTIEVSGQVHRILENSVGDDFRRHATHLLRTVIKSNDHSGRHINQRFLLASSGLCKNEQLLVVINTAFGKHALREGIWVRVRGVYIHRRSKKRALWGTKLSLYGLLHKVHAPHGFLHILAGEANAVECQVTDTFPRRDDVVERSARPRGSESESY